MDAGNSASMQSSSGGGGGGGGGDEEFDSRTESISPFLTSSSTNPLHQHQPPPNPTLLFDSSHLSNYLSHHHDPFSSTTRSSPSQNPNNSSLLHNLDMVWPNPRTNTLIRSEPNYTHFNSSSSATPPHLHGSTTNFSPIQTHFQTTPPSSSLPPPDRAKNSKKRSRASRRAPTTVLTTDTSNFRAMVQEFTGIPAPPFSSSPFPRTRFDLFNNSSSSAIRSGLSESSPPSYLLRPFAQKLHPPSFLSSSSSTSTNNVIPATTNPTSPNNYQLLSELALSNKQSTHHQNLLNIQNPSLTFQSLLQSSPLLPPPITTHNSQMKMVGTLESSRTQMGSIQNLLSTSLEPMRNDNISSWRDCVGSNNEDHQRVCSNEKNFDNPRVADNGRKLTTSMNYSSSSPAEKRSSAENNSNNNNVSGTGRGEGMVDSWICSSD